MLQRFLHIKKPKKRPNGKPFGAEKRDAQRFPATRRVVHPIGKRSAPDRFGSGLGGSSPGVDYLSLKNYNTAQTKGNPVLGDRP